MTITVQVATMPDREFPIAELWLGKHMIAEINQENDGTLMIEIYDPALSTAMALEDLHRALVIAKEALAAPSAFESSV